jgi:hypothetical protein
MSWVSQDVVHPIPSSLATLVSGTSSLISSITPVLHAASTLLTAAEVFFSPTTNLYAAFVTGLLTEAQNFNNDLFDTGVYQLTVSGDTIGGVVKYDSFGIPLLTPGQAIQAAISSLSDLGDVNRPQFNNTAEVTAIGFMATAPSPDQFITLINNLLNIMNLQDWLNFSVKFTRRITPPIPQSVPPDWQSLRLNSIQDLASVQQAVNNLISTLLGYQVIADNIITQLVNLINAKTAQLTALNVQLTRLINDLKATTGMYVMNLPPTIGGNSALIAAFTDCPLSQSTNQYTICSIFVGGGVSLEPVNLFRQMVL